MKGIRKSLGTGISMLLLLLFSVTVLPLDFLHNHSSIEQTCSNNKASCGHTVHITKKASYCWLCAIHYDKNFSAAVENEVSPFFPAFQLLIDNAITGYAAEILYNALRGPPSE